ncbi:MAG: RES family NAD+ phosphorylase [Immundisolibacteraceae bacterium]|nr:RES family NAD+ phosphorylase [Immundisolibacteraceae bacterium]
MTDSSPDQSKSTSWDNCLKNIATYPVQGQLFRVVESQEQIATNSLVDNLQEQEALEQLLEISKPDKPAGTEQLHYPLATPFRYPPLKHGSRFGQKFEPSLLYGSQQLSTAIAETAYYRFLFWQGMITPPPAALITQHTIFDINYSTDKGLQLQQPPFVQHSTRLTQPTDYVETQKLGSAMRQVNVEAFEFISARDPDQGINVGLFSPAALSSRKPRSQQSGLCQTSAEGVWFSTANGNRNGQTSLYQFDNRHFIAER